ncbi:MAG: bifunctional phosphoserine phosphatase/homoserine phosphotransferase ThrH [Treponema sp.]|nr:bifunctional phosphoserine phosphatase/homoserine phosphotransferase ThrH [Treponema sp.]
MRLVCLDLEGVLVPEIWIAFSQATGIPELQRTTRDEPDYDKLMRFRLGILAENGLKLADIQKVISGLEPLPGAADFTRLLRERTQLVILSDTFEQFAKPLMEKLSWPCLFCNTLETGPGGEVTGYRLRQKDGKRQAVMAFKSMGLSVFAAGDSFNDLSMIHEADSGCLFRAPESIRKEQAGLACFDAYDDLLSHIDGFLRRT